MTPTTNPTATIGGRVIPLLWNRVARYRLSLLGHEEPGEYAAALDILHAASSAAAYPAPAPFARVEDLAAALTDEEEAGARAAVDSLISAATAEKKSSLMNGLSPASTSVSQPTNGSPLTTTPSTP